MENVNLLDYLTQGKKMGTSCLFVKPDIPEKRKKNALKKICGDLDLDDEMLVLIDNTVFGSGKSGVVITNKYIYAKEFIIKLKFAFKDIEEFWTQTSHTNDGIDMFINGCLFRLTMGKRYQINVIFDNLKQYLQTQYNTKIQAPQQQIESEEKAEIESEAETKIKSKAENKPETKIEVSKSNDNKKQKKAAARTNLFDYLKQEKQVLSYRLYVKPYIPENIKQNALKKICPDLSPNDEILVLMDYTITYSGKDGVVITNESIYFKDVWESPNKFAFKDIEYFFTTINRDDNDIEIKIFVNMNLFVEMLLSEKENTVMQVEKEVDRIFNGLKQYLKKRYKTKIQDPKQSMREEYLLDIIEHDEFFNHLMNSDAMKGGARAVAMATDLFANFVLNIETRFSEKSDEQVIKDHIKKSIMKIVSSMRNNAKRLEFLELQNNMATIEFIIFASYLIHNEFVNMGYNDTVAFAIIRMAFFDIFGYSTRYYLPVFEAFCSIETFEEALLFFLLRLYYTNKMGINTIPVDFGSQTMDLELFNELASNLTTFATKKGIKDKINPYENLERSIVDCMSALGVQYVINEAIIHRAYRCVEELCNK